ncbi:MAG: class I SAM-dependent methyltransferase, partial [Ignavibacteriaceae bacterium]|nr:class I SAM-dependent methyltransferase [Ignavibacteriaceae bacterium]
FSATYDENQEYVVGKTFLNEVKRNINNLTDLGEVLELGCGTGYFTGSIVKNAKHVFATDLSDELLEKARERLGDNDKITFQKENCMKISFESNKFNTVFMANLIHVIENPSKVLQECFRVLKDDGLLIITSFTNYSMKPWEIIKLGLRFMKVWGKPPRYTHRFSPDSLGSLMASKGFSIEESKILGIKTKSLFLTGRKKYH